MPGGKRRQSIYFRVVASLTAVAALSLFTVFCFFYPMVIEAAYKRVEERRTGAMAQTVRAMDRMFSQLGKVAALTEKDADLRPYRLRSGDTMALYEAQKKIANYNATQANAYVMFYHIIGSDKVVGSSGVISLSSFDKDAWMLDGLDQASLHALLEAPAAHHLTLLPQDAIHQTTQTSKVEVLPFVLSISGSGNPYASLLVFLKASDIAAELRRSWENEALFITDGSQILFSTDPEQTGALDALQLSTRAQGARLNAGRSLYLSPSALYGFSYGALCRPDSLYEELKALRTTAALFLLASCAIALFAALLISRWNYQPVRQLCDSVGVDLTVKGQDSELLRERFSSLLSVNAALTENMKQSQSLLEDAIVQRFLVSAPEERAALIERGEKAGVFAQGCRCTVAVALPGAPGGDMQASRPEPGAYRLYQAAGDGHYALLAAQAAGTPQEETLRTLRALAAGGRVCYAPPCEDWRAVPDAYALLLKKLHALRRMDEGALVALDDPRLTDEPDTPFGADALDELADGLSVQQEEGVRLSVSHLCGCLSETDRPLHERRALLLDALCMLCEALEGQGGLDAQTLEKLNPLAQGRMEDEKRMESLLRGAAEAVTAGMPRAGASRQRQLPQDVLLYVDKHLLDPDFSIYTVSEAFGLSESAFSHLFKRTFHQTFSTYVNQQKLICAFELLADEDIPLEEVATRLGYSRASNFGRMFKAEVGMSPGRYRNQYGRKHAAD